MIQNSTAAASRASESQVLAELVDQLIEDLSRGDSVSIDQLRAAHPEQAEALGALWPALEVMCGLKTSLDAANSGSLEFAGSGPPMREVIGDFRIIRQLGRGGMGIVYEAEQASMSRKVALKELPTLACK